jgi:hypothetical protein
MHEIASGGVGFVCYNIRGRVHCMVAIMSLCLCNVRYQAKESGKKHEDGSTIAFSRIRSAGKSDALKEATSWPQICGDRVPH